MSGEDPNTKLKNGSSFQKKENYGNQSTSGQNKKLLEMIRNLHEKIQEANEQKELTILEQLLKNVDKLIIANPNFDELFFIATEAYSETLHSQEEKGDLEFLENLIQQILNLITKFISNDDFLAALCDLFLLAIEVLVINEYLEQTEIYVKFIIDYSNQKPDNILLRTTAADSIILTQDGFGSEWNLEKILEYGLLLRNLLPPKGAKGILAGILINGLASEIDIFGDMNEFSELKKSLTLMREVFTNNEDCKFEIINNYTFGLINALQWFGEDEKVNEMNEILNELVELIQTDHCSDEVKISYAQGLSIALDLTGVLEDLELATKNSKLLLSLAEELSENNDLQMLALTSVLKVANWASLYWETGVITSLLSNIKKIVNRQSDNLQLLIEYSKGLFLITGEISQIGREKILEEIIKEQEELYENNSDNIELAQYYSKSLVNMTYLLGDISNSLDQAKHCLEKLTLLTNNFPENFEISLSYSKALVNIIRMFGKFGKITEMVEYLSLLKSYAISTDEREIVLRLGKAYIDAILTFGEMNELEDIPVIYGEINEWAEGEYGDIDFQMVLAKSLVNIISSYGKNNKFIDMEIFLEKLKELCFQYDDIMDIQTQLANGLSLAIKWTLNTNENIKSKYYLDDLEKIYLKYPGETSIQSAFARTLRRMFIFYSDVGDTELSNLLIEKLRMLFSKHAINEDIQVELARALSQMIISNSSRTSTINLHSLIMEFKGLNIQFPRNEKLSSIYQLVLPLLGD